MFLEMLAPNKKIFQGEIESITLPGKDGSFQILNSHAPLIANLTTGEIKCQINKKKVSYFSIENGVVEVKYNKVNVLIEKLLEK